MACTLDVVLHCWRTMLLLSSPMVTQHYKVLAIFNKFVPSWYYSSFNHSFMLNLSHGEVQLVGWCPRVHGTYVPNILCNTLISHNNNGHWRLCNHQISYEPNTLWIQESLIFYILLESPNCIILPKINGTNPTFKHVCNQ
jgi:hypothetical protein